MTSHRTFLAAAAALLICLLGPSLAQARTETLRVFSKVQQFTFTTADGTVTHAPPSGPPQAGDVMEIDSIDFKGNHKKHAKKAFASDYLQCTFGDDPQNPDCFGYTAIKGSLLRFHGFDLIGGTGRYLGASGKVVRSKEVKGGSDFVLRIKLP
jgi:hypothetical protein